MPQRVRVEHPCPLCPAGNMKYIGIESRRHPAPLGYVNQCDLCGVERILDAKYPIIARADDTLSISEARVET